MKIASIYRKDGKVILETDNDAITQVATDTPQDVIVAPPPPIALAVAAAHYGHDLSPETLVRLEGLPQALEAPYGSAPWAVGGVLQRQDVPPSGMATLRQIVTELRTRHVAGCKGPSPTLVAWADRIEVALRGLDDHARLQEDAERLDWLEGFVRRAYVYGASFDFARSCEGEPGGYRFRTRRRLAARQPTLRAAIDAAKAVQP